MSFYKIICFVGPTGVGKSSIALRIAQQHNATIINADSRQLYADFPIITAQPTAIEQSLVPHKLYGYIDVTEKISAGKWVKQALAAIYKVVTLGGVPFFVGGTGMYLRALFDGIVSIPEIPDTIKKIVENEAKEKGLSFLYNELMTYDPVYAGCIHVNDRHRIMRALMVYKATGKTFSWWHKKTLPSISATVLRIGIKMSLVELMPYVVRRIDTMIDQGAIQEIKKTYVKCTDEHAPGWSSIGASEILGNVTGKYSLNTAKEYWIKNTRAYAKRQLTWFNADKRIIWFHPKQSEEICQYVKSWLDNA